MKEKSLTLAAIGAALTASLCCIGPLVAVMVGLGTFGVAAVFEKFRPLLLGITGLLLAGAFYLAYRPQKTVACAEGVCAPNSMARHGKALLWIATVLVALFAVFPYYSPLVWKSLAKTHGQAVTSLASAQSSAGSSLVLHVEGMTCGGCAAAVQSSLSRLEGIREASVSYEEKSAIVKYDASRVTVEQMIQAIEKAGYKASLGTTLRK